MGEKVGYARVSTREQNLSSQIDALNNAGCIRIFTDKISGKEFKREGLTACLDYLRADDTLVIYRLDRLGRSVKEMLDLCAKLEQRRIKLVSLQDNLDTSTAVGRFTMQILASLAEYNRNLILEGCKAGIEAAQKRGVKFGRKTGSTTKKPKKEAVITMYKAGTSIKDIMSITGIKSIQTIYNYLKGENIQPDRRQNTG
ncbi:recombinase family protein [Phocaeicola vulgatus]|uniref:recombinase family protein n=1 Tax=Phocaeicola vulgatus TaxID=821 RepID=UPI0018A0EE23|nr:recombinase family protein [Phocaeicola vulgatus]MDB1035403.1 recombinase family protein [Phocaeicola vulgatus]MDB1048376.1 recombinase family protein [Phocaeicola vulgatus]MDB1053137.1 recombinase family protein [Phocaeicola vulgatus]